MNGLPKDRHECMNSPTVGEEAVREPFVGAVNQRNAPRKLESVDINWVNVYQIPKGCVSNAPEQNSSNNPVTRDRM